ncbi:MAG TPA: polysaccharide deacetylase family protein [Prolixibacteraceae bacterium]|jgi:peptidoglycan/xylan/chitin deacetylase (PgdA/CDA1 family)|nr:polysaccharide deacetylase family protein [Prolixibacteraceae bacterium]HUM88032.1 polysaccharide deacetylase family protein [Prolixibacteraceae bacterium]
MTSEKNKALIASLSQFIPLVLLRSGQKYPPFLPFYHVVNDTVPEYINSYEVRSTTNFRKELDYLLKHFLPVDLKTIVNKPQKNMMHLSFDDGLKECYTTIAPILKEKGIPATFFVSPGFVDNKSLFHRFKRAILEERGILTKSRRKFFIHEASELDELAKNNNISFAQYLNDHQPYMSLSEIKELQADGFTIGAHSIDHAEFWLLPYSEQFRQIEESMNWMVSNINPDIKAFSFPFTDDGISKALFEEVKAKKLVDVCFGTAGLKYDTIPFNLQRIPVERKQNWDVRKVVHFEYFYYFARSIAGKNKVNRQ